MGAPVAWPTRGCCTSGCRVLRFSTDLQCPSCLGHRQRLEAVDASGSLSRYVSHLGRLLFVSRPSLLRGLLPSNWPGPPSRASLSRRLPAPSCRASQRGLRSLARAIFTCAHGLPPRDPILRPASPPDSSALHSNPRSLTPPSATRATGSASRRLPCVSGVYATRRNEATSPRIRRFRCVRVPSALADRARLRSQRPSISGRAGGVDTAFDEPGAKRDGERDLAVPD